MAFIGSEIIQMYANNYKDSRTFAVAVGVLKTRASLLLWRRDSLAPPCRTDRTRAEDGMKRGPSTPKWPDRRTWQARLRSTYAYDRRVFVQLMRSFALKPRGTQHTRLIFGVFCTDWRNLSITRLSIIWVKQGWKWHPILLRNPRQSSGRVALHLCLQWQRMGNECMCMRV